MMKCRSEQLFAASVGLSDFANLEIVTIATYVRAAMAEAKGAPCLTGVAAMILMQHLTVGACC